MKSLGTSRRKGIQDNKSKHNRAGARPITRRAPLGPEAFCVRANISRNESISEPDKSTQCTPWSRFSVALSSCPRSPTLSTEPDHRNEPGSLIPCAKSNVNVDSSISSYFFDPIDIFVSQSSVYQCGSDNHGRPNIRIPLSAHPRLSLAKLCCNI